MKKYNIENNIYLIISNYIKFIILLYYKNELFKILIYSVHDYDN